MKNHNQTSQSHILTFRSVNRRVVRSRSRSGNRLQASRSHIGANRFDWERGSGWGFFIAGVGLLLMVVLGGLFYITQVTGSAVEGYDVTKLERKVDDLRAQQRRLELEAAELQSLKNIEGRVEKLNMVSSDSVAFTSPVVSGTTARVP